MTKKLYYEEGYLQNFEATIVSCESYKSGYCVVLEETAFYPEGGGQPSDQGVLDEAKVSHVFIKEGIIYHVVDRPLEVGKKIIGKIDFKRRFDYMQQHTGEHILSGLINKLYQYNNVGFHLSETYMTADFDGELTKEQVQEIEQLANEAVYKNIHLHCEIYPKEEIENIPYRSKLELDGEVRLVRVEGYDVCACCGIHVAYTGEVGLIKIISADRHRGGTRLTILCGNRALKDYSKKQEIVSELMSLLSAKEELVPHYTKKLQEELGSTKQKLAAYWGQLIAIQAKEIASKAKGPICLVEEGLTSDELRKVCLAICQETEEICLLLSEKEGDMKYVLGAKNRDVRPLCKTLNKAFSGKGGGQAELCQGSLVGSFEELKAYIEKGV